MVGTFSVSGPVFISLDGSDYAFPVTVFEGGRLTSLDKVASGAGAVAFVAEQGHCYHFSVADTEGLTGEIQMALQAPVVQAPFLHQLSSSRQTLLFFKASRGQVLILQRSNNALDWETVDKAACRRSSTVFRIRNPTSGSPIYYRALIVDMLAL